VSKKRKLKFGWIFDKRWIKSSYTLCETSVYHGVEIRFRLNSRGLNVRHWVYDPSYSRWTVHVPTRHRRRISVSIRKRKMYERAFVRGCYMRRRLWLDQCRRPVVAKWAMRPTCIQKIVWYLEPTWSSLSGNTVPTWATWATEHRWYVR